MIRHMVTANRLSDGAVLYLTPAGDWRGDFSAAWHGDKESAEDKLVLAQAAIAAQIIVAPYIIDVTVDGGVAQPVRFRERIRAEGPTTQIFETNCAAE